MQRETELISKSIKVPAGYTEKLVIHRLKDSAISTLKKMGDAATNLVVYGEKFDGNYIYLFDIYKYPNFTNPVDVSYKVMDDLTSSGTFNKIHFVCFQAAILYKTSLFKLKSSINLNRDQFENKAILFVIETFSNKNTSIIYIDANNNPIEKDQNSATIESAEEYGIPEFKKYLKNKNMSTSAAEKQKSIWDSLSIKKEEFDWIDEIIEESKKEKRSLTDTIKIIVRTVRNNEFDINNNSKEGQSDCTWYEIKLFLAGKIFEEKLKKQVQDGKNRS